MRTSDRNGPADRPPSRLQRLSCAALACSALACPPRFLFRPLLLCLSWAALSLAVVEAAAAEAPMQTAAASVSAIGSEVVKPGLYRIAGADGASLLRVGGQGVIVVDAQRAAGHGELMAEIRRIAKGTSPPGATLLLTSAGAQQAGRLAQFADAGVQVIVQRRALAQLPPATRPSSGRPAARPFITYDTDYQLSVGDIQAEAEHVGSGRTGADSVIFFRDLRVLAVGDLYTHGTPQPDCASGGSFAGWAAAIAHLLYFDFDVAVPSHGAPVGKRELQALKARLETLAADAASPAAIASGCRPPR